MGDIPAAADRAEPVPPAQANERVSPSRAHSEIWALIGKISQRAVQTLIVLFGISVIAFTLVRMAPGNPAALLLPVDATAEQLAAMETRMGLDLPPVVQYLRYLGNIVQGDLGYSYFYQQDVSTLISRALPNTALLGLASMLISLGIAIPLGMLAAIKRGTVWDALAMFAALIGQSMSSVWFAVLLVLVFAVKLGWLPTSGSGGFVYIILPALCLAFQDYALSTRMLRSGMIGALGQDYVMAAKARGIAKRRIHWRYAFKNAVLPLLTVVGSQIGGVLAGSLIVERIFNWPGIGLLMANAIATRDFQLIQSILLISGLIYTVLALLVDALYTLLDKRIAAV